ncbi:MAG: hypothetical protein IPM24_02435 [Bryobacterales bacterium]|nr:hypothetical protein [Bryobacterales bacterium]
MNSSALYIQLRPAGPWRIGPDSGDRNRTGTLLHSDTVYAAVCAAMHTLGRLPAWLEATARAQEPAVRFSSAFPWHGDIRLVTPPRSHWPPEPSAKIRWKGARFVPLSVAEAVARGESLDEEKWIVDGPSECLVPAGESGPFRVGLRSAAAMDRFGAGIEPFTTACVEFAPRSGLWLMAAFAGDAARDAWGGPLQEAFRLLADSGIGGERSRGWGRAHSPAFEDAPLPFQAMERANGEPRAWWLLSLFTPAADDAILWDRGTYTSLVRGGRVESPDVAGALKRQMRMITEGSVLLSAAPPCGHAPDVAPDGFPHPVYRAGFAFALPLPVQGNL